MMPDAKPRLIAVASATAQAFWEAAHEERERCRAEMASKSRNSDGEAGDGDSEEAPWWETPSCVSKEGIPRYSVVCPCCFGNSVIPYPGPGQIPAIAAYADVYEHTKKSQRAMANLDTSSDEDSSSSSDTSKDAKNDEKQIEHLEHKLKLARTIAWQEIAAHKRAEQRIEGLQKIAEEYKLRYHKECRKNGKLETQVRRERQRAMETLEKLSKVVEQRAQLSEAFQELLVEIEELPDMNRLNMDE